MKSASNGGVISGSRQVLHVFLAAPQCLGNALYTPDGYAGQVHLDESLFHVAFTTTVPLNDGSLKGDPLEGNIPGSGGEVGAVVAAAIALAMVIVFVPGWLWVIQPPAAH